MSITPEQAQWFATTEPFRSHIRDLIKQIERMEPLLAVILRGPQRHRARLVTRRKQRNHW